MIASFIIIRHLVVVLAPEMDLAEAQEVTEGRSTTDVTCYELEIFARLAVAW